MIFCKKYSVHIEDIVSGAEYRVCGVWSDADIASHIMKVLSV